MKRTIQAGTLNTVNKLCYAKCNLVPVSSGINLLLRQKGLSKVRVLTSEVSEARVTVSAV